MFRFSRAPVLFAGRTTAPLFAPFAHTVPLLDSSNTAAAAAAAAPEQPKPARQHTIPTKTSYHPTELNSAYELLRLLLRSAELKIKSRQGRKFFKRRVVEQWRVGRNETDPVKQRALMERAAACLHALHVKGRNPNPAEPIEIDFSKTTFRDSAADAPPTEGKAAPA